MSQVYNKQVSILLSVLPEVAKENELALHGGTAINLFYRNMPRLSVDIDLTYLPFDERNRALAQIAIALERIKSNLEKVIRDVKIISQPNVGKMFVSIGNTTIKLEVSLVNRGALSTPTPMPLCEKAQNLFGSFCIVPVVSAGQLFGGKIIAALDRQHPRDMFDVKYLLEQEGFSEEVKAGFLLLLICSDRPIHEIICPNLQNQQSAFVNQFSGMTVQEFSYEDFENYRELLIKTIRESLTLKDKEFLLNIHNLTPDWSHYDFQRFPAVQWKLHNLNQLKKINRTKYKNQYNELMKQLQG